MIHPGETTAPIQSADLPTSLREKALRDEHERIWLEPNPGDDPEGRMWCQDNFWGDEAVEYVRADIAEAKDRRIEALEAENADLKKQLAAERKPDFFWDYKDPENSYDSPDEAVEYADMGSVVHLFTGKSLPQIWATTRVLTVDERGDWDDHEVAVFDNEADAKRCWPESLAAARAALSGKEGQS